MEKIKAPWNERQVHNLHEYQKFQPFHPFTCECGDHILLIPSKTGWNCPKCKKTQNWAWDVMLDGTMLRAFRKLLRTIQPHPETTESETNATAGMKGMSDSH